MWTSVCGQVHNIPHDVVGAASKLNSCSIDLQYCPLFSEIIFSEICNDVEFLNFVNLGIVIVWGVIVQAI